MDVYVFYLVIFTFKCLSPKNLLKFSDGTVRSVNKIYFYFKIIIYAQKISIQTFLILVTDIP